ASDNGEIVEQTVTGYSELQAALTAHHVGRFVITYTAVDLFNNSASNSRTVLVTDSQPPSLTLNSPLTITVEAGDASSFVEPGYSATDVADGNLTASVVQPNATVLASMFANKAYDTSLTYFYLVSDAAGNAAAPRARVIL